MEEQKPLTIGESFLGFVGLVAIIGGVYWFFTKEPAEPKTPPPELVWNDECRADIDCVIEYANKDYAQIKCERALEDLAKYEVRWDNSWAEPRWNKGVLEGNTLSIIGDAISYQNGFSAFQKHAYFCKWDVENKVLLEVYAEPK